MKEDLVAIAKIAKPRGLRGELVADVLTDFPERFEHLDKVLAIKPDSLQKELEIERFWFQKERIILKFKGYDTIEAADTLRDYEVCIAEDEAVELDSDEFFDWELQDCEVVTLEGEKIGKVKEVLRTGGTDVLVVQGETKDYLIPFAGAICPEIDLENKLIKIDAPEGLLDF